MAKKKTYMVKSGALTVHQKVGDLIDPVTGRVTGIQQGNGRVATAGTVLDESEISPAMLEALGDEEHPSHEYTKARLEEYNESSSLPEPFPGYDDMETEQIVGLMQNLPTRAIKAIKQYEEGHEERPEITNHAIGFGESPEARQTGMVGGQLEDANEDKAVGRIRSRDDRAEGIVHPGEGVTGNAPVIPHGSVADEEDDDESGSSGGGQRRTVQRRGRRARTQKPADSSEGSGSGDGGSGDE